MQELQELLQKNKPAGHGTLNQQLLQQNPNASCSFREIHVWTKVKKIIHRYIVILGELKYQCLIIRLNQINYTNYSYNLPPQYISNQSFQIYRRDLYSYTGQASI